MPRWAREDDSATERAAQDEGATDDPRNE